MGLRLLFARDGASATPVRIQPHHYARQAFLITLMNPKAIVFYMAFFPLFIDPATHRGGLTFVVMALTIAVITAVYCLLLCAFAQRLRERVHAHPRLPRLLQRIAGGCLVAFGVRLGTPS
jgi:threonine/homoserine/homoserine lactone efflux protein